jgi:uncharacterized protein YdeI (YjbR/CyaY-like superfamily)
MAEGPLPFAAPSDWRDWLDAHHATEPEAVVKLYRKSSGIPSITWEEAVIEALAYGWIDGVKRSGGPDHWLQRFTPRKARSTWSQKNRAHVERLIAEGRMAPAGLAQVDAAKADGRWEAAYSGGRAAQVPQDFLDALTPEAARTYATLNAQNRYAIYYRLTTAKRPETRAKRIADFVAMLARGERFHP